MFKSGYGIWFIQQDKGLNNSRCFYSQMRFLTDLSYTVSQYLSTRFLITVGQKVKNFKS